jgi:hypothetical protein
VKQLAGVVHRSLSNKLLKLGVLLPEVPLLVLECGLVTLVLALLILLASASTGYAG